MKRHFLSLLLLPKAPGDSAGGFRLPGFCRCFYGALGRTRTCDLQIRSHSPSRTGVDTVRQGETKRRFYQVLALLEGQGGTPGCGQNCGQCSRHPGFRTIGDSGGCEKRASEPGDEAFEVGARPFSMLRPSCRLCFTARTPLLPLRPPPGPARRCRCSRRWHPRCPRHDAGVCRQERSRGCPRARR